jgi:hypothetical protein
MLLWTDLMGSVQSRIRRRRARIEGAAADFRSPSMKCRDHFTTVATPVLPDLDRTYLAARERLTTGKPLEESIPRQQYGHTKEHLSVIGFGGMVVQDVTARHKAALGLRFTLHLPVTVLIPPGHWELFRMVLDLAQAGALVPLNDQEQELIRQIARKSDPLFPPHD